MGGMLEGVIQGIAAIGNFAIKEGVRDATKQVAKTAVKSQAVEAKVNGFGINAMLAKRMSKATANLDHPYMQKFVTPIKDEWKDSWIQNLPEQHGVASSYLTMLIQHASSKAQLKTIVSYIKSHSASNITDTERAQLLVGCFEKMKLFDLIHLLH